MSPNWKIRGVVSLVTSRPPCLVHYKYREPIDAAWLSTHFHLTRFFFCSSALTTYRSMFAASMYEMKMWMTFQRFLLVNFWSCREKQKQNDCVALRILEKEGE
ncbi:unnamed protein product [Amoebophrya sp. A120]|nr:unnamed protein product [Amoebophrya sp. A120]|eukprot:GSA120T00015006001.1